MTDQPENPLVFPHVRPDGGGASGMSLRDWFAGQALAGLTTATDSAGTWQTVGAEINAAVAAYAFADAMLAERAKADPQ